MRTSPEGRALIKTFEKLRLTAYDDGTGVLTIGWGHTHGVRPGDTCTPAEAEAFLDTDLAPGEAALAALPPLTQSAYDALSSLCLNCGPRAVAADSTIGRALRARDWIAAWRGLTLWIQPLPLGLARRRAAEGVLFLKDGIPLK